MDQTRTYISSRSRELSKRVALLPQPSLEETAARPVPPHIPGQLLLFLDAETLPGVVGEIAASVGPYGSAHD